MGLKYSVTASAALTAAADLIELLAPSDATVLIHSLTIVQGSDAGDSESEMVPILISRVTGAPTSGSGGSTPTPTAVTPGAAAASSTVEANNTTQLSGGTRADYIDTAFNIHVGYEKIWTPEFRLEIAPSTRFLVELQAAPADSLTIKTTLEFEEMGG